MENKFDIDNIIKALKHEDAVLFVGPDLATNVNGVSLYKTFCIDISNKNKDKITYDEKEGFFFFNDPLFKNEVKYLFKEYYDDVKLDNLLLQKIAEIPFHLIISLTPDDILHKVFTNFNVEHEFAYYDGYKSEPQKPTQQKPLIYNLLGLASDAKYILTEEDFYNYIEAVLSKNLLPVKLRSALDKASNYIFVGFEFDKWYVRLLLLILSFHLNKDEKRSHAIKPENVKFLFQKLIEKQFEITFVETGNSLFINDLHSKTVETKLNRKLISTMDLVKNEITEKTTLLNRYKEKLDLGGEPTDEIKWEKAIAQLETEIKDLKQKLI